jgi:hypothetical protein
MMSLTQVDPFLRSPADVLTSTTPLPMPLTGWGAWDALAAVAESRDLLPVMLPAPVVVSALTTVVLRCGPWAVKVYPPGTDPAHLVSLAGAMAGSTSAHLPIGPPVVTPHGVVTVTPWLPRARSVSWRELGSLLRDFHEQHASADVPAWAPLSRLTSQVASLPDEAAAVLLGARDVLLGALAEVRSVLGDGVVHGDVSPSNVLRGPAGPMLIDLDWVARAPREYDLSSASRRLADGEISAWAYAGFCSSYGFDVRSWPGLPVLDRIADLGGVAFRIWDCRHHGAPLDWLEGELAAWRTPL